MADTFLLTMRPFDRAAGARVTLRIADVSYRTLPGDDLPNEYFENALAGFRYERSAFRPGNVGGASLPGRLSVTIKASALSQAERVAWLGYAWGGHPYVLEKVPSGSAYADRVVVGRGTMAALDQTSPDTLVLAAHDPGEDLATALQARLYLGTGGFEGPVELQGRPRPIVLGHDDNAEGVMVDPAELWVDFHDGAVVSFDELRDNGAPLTVSGSYPPAAGHYWKDLVRGRCKLGSIPVGAITATMVGAAGYSNLLPRSEDFTQWTSATTGGVVLSVGSNVAEAPDGATTADSLTATGGVTGTAAVSRVVTVDDTVHALSVHAEADAGDWLLLQADRDDNDSGGRFGAYFDLAAGEVGTTIATNGASDVQAYMVPMRSTGGYRCVVSGELPSGMTSLRCHVALAGGDAGESFSATGQSVRVWGAMLNEGAVAEPYVATAAAAVAVTAPSTLGEVCRYILGRFAATLYPSGFDVARMTALDTARPGMIGRALGTSPVDTSSVLDQLVGGQNCFRWFTRAGLFAAAPFDPPAATASSDASIAAVITAYEVREGSVRRSVPGISPWRIVPRYRVLGLVQASDQLAGSVTAANRLRWGTDALSAPPIEDRAVLRAFPRSATLPLTTYLKEQAAAVSVGQSVAAALADLALYRFETLTGFAEVELGDEAWFEHADYGLDDGVAALVVGGVEEMRGLVQLELAVMG